MKEGFLEPLTEFPLRVSVTTVRLDWPLLTAGSGYSLFVELK